MKPFYAMRSLGGTLYLAGALIMVYNLYKTVKAGKLVANEAAEAAPLQKLAVKACTVNTGIGGLKEGLYN